MVDTSGKRRRNLPCRLSDSEVMTILVLFHTMHFRDLKSFYLGYVCQHMKKEFPHTVFYNRFVERQAQVPLHLLLFLQTCALGKCTGIFPKKVSKFFGDSKIIRTFAPLEPAKPLNDAQMCGSFYFFPFLSIQTSQVHESSVKCLTPTSFPLCLSNLFLILSNKSFSPNSKKRLII